MPCNVHMLLILCMRNYILLVCRILLTTFLDYYFHREKRVQEERPKEEKRLSPFLICKGSLESHDRIYLAADKHIICDFEGSLVESALALLAGYYVFMFNYPARLTNFFLFLQKCILHIQDGKKLPASVISLVNSFHEHQSVLATCCASRSV